MKGCAKPSQNYLLGKKIVEPKNILLFSHTLYKCNRKIFTLYGTIDFKPINI